MYKHLLSKPEAQVTGNGCRHVERALLHRPSSILSHASHVSLPFMPRPLIVFLFL